MTKLRVTFRNAQRTTIEAGCTARELSDMVRAALLPDGSGWVTSEDDRTAICCADVILIETLGELPAPPATTATTANIFHGSTFVGSAS